MTEDRERAAFEVLLDDLIEAMYQGKWCADKKDALIAMYKAARAASPSEPVQLPPLPKFSVELECSLMDGRKAEVIDMLRDYARAAVMQASRTGDAEAA